MKRARIIKPSGNYNYIKYNKIGSNNENKYSEQYESRKCEVIWFTSPFSLTVKTLPKLFLKILKHSFPKHHKYYPICNKSSTKCSYSTMRILGSIIASINKNEINYQTLTTFNTDRKLNINKISLSRTPNSYNSISK